MKMPIEIEATKIIKSYRGTNDYILYYQKMLKVNPYYLISKELARYVFRNQNTNPTVMNKWVYIHPYSADQLKSFFKKEKTPDKIFINKVLSVKPKETVHVWGKMFEEETYYYSMFISRSAFTKVRHLSPISWDKYSVRPPMDHQKEAVEALIQHPKFILALDMGMGKSYASIIAAKELNFNRILVVCPATLKINWKREIIMAGEKEDSIAIVDGNDWKYAKWVIVNYDILRNFHYMPERGVKTSDLPLSPIQISNFDLVILDEGQKLQDASSNRSKIVNSFIEEIPNRWLLTGTPIMNRPINYFNLLQICESPLADNWQRYVKTYCAGRQFTNRATKKKYWSVGGNSNLDDLHRYTQNLILRRMKSEVKDLPEKIIQPIYLPLTSTVMYDKYMNEYEDWLNELDEKGEEAPVWEHLSHLIKIRQMLSLDKISTTVELAKDFIEEGKKVVIFTCFTETLDYLMEKFGNEAVRLDGAMALINRQRSVDAFQNNPKIKVFCGNIIAGGVGITLTSGEVVIFNDLDWVPTNHTQAEDRCIFQGQLILSKNGYIPIENIGIGDYVYSGKGNLQKVISKSTHLERKKLQINIKYFGFNQPLSITEDHLVHVYDDIDKKFVWKSAIKVRPRIDYLTFPIRPINDKGASKIKLDESFITPDSFVNNFGVTQKNERKFSIPQEIKLTDDLLFAFGWYVAEGWSNNGNKNKGFNVSICGNAKKETDLVRKVIDTLMKSFNILTKNEYTNKKNCISTSIYSKQLAGQFISWFGHGAHSKKFPEWVFELNKIQMISLLNGYFKGDGYFRENQQSSATVSPILAGQLMMLNAMLNRPITTQINKKKQFIFVYTSNEDSNCRIRIIDNYIIFPISEVLIKIAPKRKGNKTGLERVYDLEIENDSTFIVGAAIVHNCMRVGQKNNVNIFYPLFDDTLDITMFEALTNKKAVINTVMGDTDTAFNETMVKYVIEKLKYKTQQTSLF
jgi:SWI/SNF-related matrix-associated actin-dependent regulator 1 of chromatin subfamily A